MTIFSNYKLIPKNDQLAFWLLIFFPVSLILGNLIINIFFFLFSLSFFINFKKNNSFYLNKYFYLIIFFFLTLVVNLFFSTYFLNSFPRVFKIILVILFTIETSRFFVETKDEVINQIFKFWFIVFIIISFDIIYETLFGQNVLGFDTELKGRVASFFGDELVVGNYYYGFILFILSFYLYNFKNQKLFLLILLSFIIISLLIGERSNFIKLIFSVTLFLFIHFRNNFKKNIIFLICITILIFIFLNINEKYKHRYFDQINTLYQKNGIQNYLKNSQYGAHYSTAYNIFKANPFFGVGIKNFRYESNKKEYGDESFKFNDVRQATHPHQIHFEFLSETGIFGYFSFIIFILGSLIIGLKYYFKSNDLYLLSSIIFIVTYIIPFLPSGSFLSTFSSGIFWLNYSIMISKVNKLTKS